MAKSTQHAGQNGLDLIVGKALAFVAPAEVLLLDIGRVVPVEHEVEFLLI